jgi:hypothetical protein
VRRPNGAFALVLTDEGIFFFGIAPGGNIACEALRQPVTRVGRRLRLPFCRVQTPYGPAQAAGRCRWATAPPSGASGHGNDLGQMLLGLAAMWVFLKVLWSMAWG